MRLLGYSGLRIRDAVTLSHDRIQKRQAFPLHRENRDICFLPFSPFVIEVLNAIPENTFFLDRTVNAQNGSGDLAGKSNAALYLGWSS